ncbi:hypothetical protein DL769_011569 [Monosporascus sp. CRB-8-3]|nr:hypothetical protein DL769_011569 [Monosporascus sp. CRB-8-3]
MPFMLPTKPIELSPVASTCLCPISHAKKTSQPDGHSEVAQHDYELTLCGSDTSAFIEARFHGKVTEDGQWPRHPSIHGLSYNDNTGDRTSESSAGSPVNMETWKPTISDGQVGATIPQSGRPKKACGGPSLLSQLFRRDEGSNPSMAVTIIKPPPGFEHLGIRRMINDVPQQAKSEPVRNEYTPSPELQELCAEGRPSWGGSLSRCGQARHATGSTGVIATRQKRLKMESKVDCVAIPYKTTSYQEPDD